MTEKREVSINLAECNRCMGCVDMCPELFEWDDENDCPVLKRTEANEEEVREALTCCPSDCIELDGGD